MFSVFWVNGMVDYCGDGLKLSRVRVGFFSGVDCLEWEVPVLASLVWLSRKADSFLFPFGFA